MYLKNAPRLKAKLYALKEQTASVIEPVLVSVAEKIVALAKNLCPVDSGDLRASIGWSFGDAPKGSVSIASGKVGNTRITIFAGNEKAYYARWVEFGTKASSPDGKRPHAATQAEPFFFPAWRALRKSVKSELAKAIRAAVKDVAAKQ